MPTVNFTEDKFLPSFGYLQAQVASESLNRKNPGWNVRFDCNRGCSFTTDFPIGYFDFYAAVSAELKDYLNVFAAQGNDIFLSPGQNNFSPHEAWHLTQKK